MCNMCTVTVSTDMQDMLCRWVGSSLSTLHVIKSCLLRQQICIIGTCPDNNYSLYSPRAPPGGWVLLSGSSIVVICIKCHHAWRSNLWMWAVPAHSEVPILQSTYLTKWQCPLIWGESDETKDSAYKILREQAHKPSTQSVDYTQTLASSRRFCNTIKIPMSWPTECSLVT